MNKARLRSMLKDITEQLNQLSREELKKEIDACPTFHIILERMGIIEPEPKSEEVVKSCLNCTERLCEIDPSARIVDVDAECGNFEPKKVVTKEVI